MSEDERLEETQESQELWVEMALSDRRQVAEYPLPQPVTSLVDQSL